MTLSNTTFTPATELIRLDQRTLSHDRLTMNLIKEIVDFSSYAKMPIAFRFTPLKLIINTCIKAYQSSG